MTDVDTREVIFQCPNCGHDLNRSIGALKAGDPMHCADCGIVINIDTDRIADVAGDIERAGHRVPPEITIKFFR